VAGAFVALTLSAGLASGVDGGVRTGMVGARLAWALLPLLLWLLARGRRASRPLSLVVPPLLAAVTLLHPAQLPAAVLLLGLAAGARAPWRRRASRRFRALALAAALTGVLDAAPAAPVGGDARAGVGDALARRGHAARCRSSRGLAVAGLLDRRAASAGERLALWWLPATVVGPRSIAWVAERLASAGCRRIASSTAPGSRSSSPAVSARRGWRAPRRDADHAAPGPRAARPDVRARRRRLFALLSLNGGTLMLRPGAAVWPSLPSIEHGLRLPDFWSLLAACRRGACCSCARGCRWSTAGTGGVRTPT